MEDNASQISEKELADKIVHMHDNLGFGYRKIAGELRKQGCKANKDSVNRLYQKFKENSGGSEQSEEKGLMLLRATEARARQRVEVQREKTILRQQLVAAFVEERTMTFEQRRRLFTDQEKLLKFAKKVMPIVDPMLWDEFSEFCQVRGYDLANAVAIALENQRDYETQLAYSLKKFDAYLRGKLSAYLTWLLEQEKRRGNSSKKGEEKWMCWRHLNLPQVQIPATFLCYFL
jgi:hypothetical protein